MSALVFSIISDWAGALLVFELGEDYLNRIGARCVALFKTGHVVWCGLPTCTVWRYKPNASSRFMYRVTHCAHHGVYRGVCEFHRKQRERERYDRKGEHLYDRR